MLRSSPTDFDFCASRHEAGRRIIICSHGDKEPQVRPRIAPEERLW
jgi:hypothetical protein